MAEKKERFNSFDTIKFLAVFLTCTIGHFPQFTPKSFDAVCETAAMSKFVDGITHFALFNTHSFMELMFLISGFQMYIAYHDRISSGSLSFSDYFIKRVKRLYPAMIISTLVMSAGLILYRSCTGSDWSGVLFIPRAFVMSILGIQAWNSDIHVLNGPLWFLSVLILCFIVYYFMEILAARFRLSVFALFIPAVLSLAHVFDPSVLLWLHNDVCRGFYGFFIGTVFAYAYRTFEKKKLTIISAVSMAAYIIFYTLYRDLYLADGFDKAVITCLMFYGPVIILLALYPKADDIVGVKPLSFMGRTSFHLYCLNFPFYLWAALLNVRFGLNINYDSFYIFVLFTVLQLALSVAMYYVIDNKFLNKVLSGKRK